MPVGSLVLDPLKRLKWGFLPVERHVIDKVDATDSEQESLPKLAEAEESYEIPEIEYRDESNRKWYKFFDEYEYRQNKNRRGNHKWYHWFNKDDTPAERKLVIKLDILLCFYSLMAYWVKYLDQTNLNNAYVSGMKESIDMKGNDLVHTQAVFTVGTIVFQIPFMYILYKAPLNYVLPSLDLCWSLFTLGAYRANNVGHLEAMRFFIGCFEAPAYLAYMYLFGSWYKVDEIVRRSMVYYIGQYLGVLTSGLLQGAIFDGMNMKDGLEGWRWMFIIDAVISIVVGIIGFYAIPGTPQKCYSIFLTDEEILLARKRLKDNSTSYTVPVDRAFFDRKLWRKILTSWHIYVLSLWNIFCWNNNNGTSGAYLLWIKSLNRYSVAKVNQLGAISPAIGILWLILTGCYADFFHSRWQAIVLSQILNITGNVILAAWDVPEGAKWFAFMLQYTGWAMAPVLYGWMNDICRHDPQYRAVILVTMNMLAQTSTAWISVLVWKTVEAPRYLKGFTFTACSAFCLVLWTFVVLWFYKRQERQQSELNGIVIIDKEMDSIKA
ncbi:hypothetical protein KL905_003341 [Ogataea polymorpha]|uniref:Major facilitator superfamily (MFS) profile domain-containing protein n=1 Tax=Ogataea polymorpha TaxID=460523 RepID=A0A9P8PT34_9ASCO|nr:hypothetical protein KL937_003021 [Ogataea polymorpha]KAG7900169.1 hypothetical protein KL935_002912 [Ogataea polymorpha]KAG7909099.1 hypothetical protein KL906_002593 [Ogataea polymorpha]KAG7916168.1 hypothetical protein KL927_003633 [Ogataea polymorpha]KAG7920707.1 hypothetical protein KL905_003341 [Ogataea polymorpha]